MTKPTKSILVALAVPLLFSAMISCTDRGSWGIEALITLPVIVAIIAHLSLVAPGAVSLWTLPLGYALCLLPNYVFSYHIISGGFMGKGFTFVIFAMYGVLPSGVIATVLAVVQAVKGARMDKKK